MSSIQTAAAADNYIGTDTLQLTPSVSIGSEYRTNLYLSQGQDFDSPTKSGAALLINPLVKLKLNGSDLNLNLAVAYSAKKYLSEELSNLDRYADARVVGGLKLFPNGKLGLILDNQFSSSGRETAPLDVSDQSSNANDDTNAYIQNINNSTHLGARFQPGSILHIDLGGEFTYQDIQDISASHSVEGDNSLNSKNATGIYWDGSWKFFPKTSVYFMGDVEWFNWEYNLVQSPTTCIIDDFCYAGIPDGRTADTVMGLTGQITDKLLLKVGGGMGSVKYDSDSVAQDLVDRTALVKPDSGESLILDQEVNDSTYNTVVSQISQNISGTDGWITELSASYYPTENQQVTISYDKSYLDVFFTNYSIYREVTLGHSWSVRDRIVLDTALRYRKDSYVGAVTRTDTRVSAANDINITVAKIADISAGWGWRRLANQEGLPDLDYDDFNLHAGLVIGY
jgi:hypothetical protein